MKERIKIKESLVFKDYCLYTSDKKGNIIDGPFCLSCWENNSKLIHMHKSSKLGLGSMWWPACSIFVGKK